MKNSKKGSVSVFLIFILSAIIGLTAVFIYVSKQKAYTGICDGALNLAMRSILSEFDQGMFDRYGLLGFDKNGMETALEINDYVDYSFKGRSPLKKTQVSFGKYSFSNVDVLEKQILEYMKTEGVIESINVSKNDMERFDYQDRTLRNMGVINTLPSKPFADGGAGFITRVEQIKNQMQSAESILSGVSERYLIDAYIMSKFKYATGGTLQDTSFFEHEVEYILSGEFSNEKNRKRVEKALKIVRIALNSAYLYADKDRFSQTLAAAELLTPGAAPATQAIIITSWATAEAENDLKLLLKGKSVPLNKTDSSWATSLDNVLNNVSEGMIDTGTDSGLYYSDYMKIFLHFQNEEIKLARIADLIQINMKAQYNRDFLIRTCNEGFHLTTQIYGKEYSYETCY